MSLIGFIGLGLMGGPMVKNLLAKKFTVKVFDVNASAVEAFAKVGATATTTISEVVQESDIVFTMVQTGQQVQQCCLGQDGIFAHLKSGALYLDCSSIDVKTSKALHKEAIEKNIAMVDAPVSGGVAAAMAATLTFMVGGTEENFRRAKQILEHLGKNIIHAGAAGSGEAAKICNNMMLGINMIAVCEAFALAEKLGLAPEKLYEICSTASGQSWSLTKYCPWPGIMADVPSSHDYKPGFAAKMMLKDLKLSQEAAESVNMQVPLGQHATDLYQHYIDLGNADHDFSGILKMIRK